MARLVEEVKKVAVKFCGGCDPVFDRGSYWERLKKASESLVTWVSLDDEGYDAVLVITGCSTACPAEQISFDPSLRVVVLTGEEQEPEQIVEILIHEEMP